MQGEALGLRLRPRSMFEACDLGVRLVQANWRSVWASFAPLFLLVALPALASGQVASWLPTLVIFWLKPWLDRTLLFVLSRAVFGSPTRWADVWAAQREVWWRQLAATLTLRRFSPWRAYTQPGLQLEGQRGAGWRARRRQLLNASRGAALAMHGAFAQLEFVLVFGCAALAVWFRPAGDGADGFPTFLSAFGASSGSLGMAAAYAAVVLLVEPFYVAAGFAMYLNRRVELEAWDVEQELRLVFAA